jgi:mono/diheme cytochrome c family protein
MLLRSSSPLPRLGWASPFINCGSLLLALAAFAITVSAAEPAPPPTTVVRRTLAPIPPFSPPGQVAAPIGGAGAAPVPHPLNAPPVGPPLPAGLLAWDAERKQSKVPFGTATTAFTFNVTNIAAEIITVTKVHTSCGCTLAKLPPVPWPLAPGATGAIEVTMTLAGKRGVLLKNLTVETNRGFKILEVLTDIQEPPAGSMSEADRARNLQIAAADRQAVFKGDCAACHAAPAVAKMGEPLYQAACVICHETGHRAASVPDLRNLGKATNADYWRAWITTSAEGKLMPAFGIDHGGILTHEQIDSLVAYLTHAIPSTPSAAIRPAPTATQP